MQGAILLTISCGKVQILGEWLRYASSVIYTKGGRKNPAASCFRHPTRSKKIPY